MLERRSPIVANVRSAVALRGGSFDEKKMPLRTSGLYNRTNSALFAGIQPFRLFGSVA